ncbi:MAG: Ig-like domain-containing protein [Candidatus Kapabacteria bacterium]|nr:Ig-like domain-containing protein [Candidatus Kapabacteria bacterium]
MKKLFTLFFVLFFVIFNHITLSQNKPSSEIEQGGELLLPKNDVNFPCVTPEQYSIILQQCADNISILKKKGIISSKNNQTMAVVKFNWPLRTVAGFNDYSYYSIFNYVDQDPAVTAIKDYNCGTATYDGHNGADIALEPYPFLLMDNNTVEVIAAAPGTIVNKADGNFDKNCARNNLAVNYVAIQHSDGTIAYYYHMKKGSITSKAIGQTVALGELLGNVGSSGSSTAPHLHFEVRNGSKVIDPFTGTCNLLNPTTWWVNQKPYTEPAVIKVSINKSLPVLPACPDTETPNEDSTFKNSGTAYFLIFMRNETTSTSANMKIMNPDGSTFSTWIHNCTNNYFSSYWYMTRTLPTSPGIYTFEASYNNLTCSKTFEVTGAKVTPNGATTFCQGDSVILSASIGVSYLWSNGETTKDIIVKSSGNYSVTIKNSSGTLNTSPIVTVTVNPLPIASITPNGKISICQNEVLILSATPASSYIWSNGETTQNIKISQSGEYFVKITNENACSSISNTVSVTINPKPDKSITASNNTLTANQSNAIYQWLDCSNSFSDIIGETKQSFTPKKSGNYALKISLNNCSDTSICSLVSIEVKVNSISLNKKISTLKIGDSINLISTILPPNATNQNVSWSSSDSKIAIVTNSGLIKALSLGNAKIIVKTIDGNFSDTCNINIVNNEIHVLQVFINRKIDTLYLGNIQKDTAQLSSVLYPSDATNSKVNWFSTDSTIASVNQNGLVKAQNLGKTSVYVKTNDGNKTDTCFISVLIPTGIEETSLNDNIIILPNPVSDFLYISIPNTQFFLIEISNIIGQTVFKSENKTRLDLSNIPKGNYLLKVKIKDQYYFKKFVKN